MPCLNLTLGRCRLATFLFLDESFSYFRQIFGLWICSYFMKTYQQGYYSIALCFDSMISYNTSVQNDNLMKRRQQNQKFPSFQMFRFAAEGWGGEFRPPSPESSVRIFSNRHRQLGNEVVGSPA